MCKEEFHNLLSNNIKVVTFGMDETVRKEIINTGLQNSYCKNRDTKTHLEVLGVVPKEIQEIGYSV
jgi:hypothetical protein